MQYSIWETGFGAVCFVGLGLAVGWWLARRHAQASADRVALAEAEANARLAQFQQPALLYDPEGNWLSSNEAARAFFESRCLMLEEIVPPALKEAVQRCAREGAAETLESRAGLIWTGWRVEALLGTGIGVFLSDITKSKEREVALQRERDAALAGIRLTMDSAGAVGRDIRLLADAAQEKAGRLLKPPKSGLQQRELVCAVREDVGAAAGLAGGLCDLARLDAGGLEPAPQAVALAGLMEEVLRDHALEALEKRCELACDVDPALPAEVTADPVRLRQLLGNLAGIALLYARRGEIFLRVMNEPPPAGSEGGGTALHFTLCDAGQLPDGHLRILHAADWGGLPMQGVEGGSGLRVAISRRLAEWLGGRLWFEGGSGMPGTLHLLLPCQAAEGARPPGLALPQEALKDRAVTIIADNPFLGGLAGGWLGRWGARVHLLAGASEARAWIDAGGRCDIALVDLDLPGEGGFALLRALSLSTPPPRMVAIAGHAPEPGMLPQGAELLFKPLGPAMFLECLSRVAALPPPAGLQVRVVIADDDPVNRKVVRMLLERIGCEVSPASNGEEALVLLGAGPCDAVFLDVHMPRMDGMQTVREIRRMEEELRAAGQPARRLPVFAITGSSTPEGYKEAMEAGFDDCVPKPVNEAQLRGFLQKVAPAPRPAVEAGASGPPAAAATPADAGSAPAPAAAARIDRERLEELASGDPEAMREIADMFFERMDALLPDIESALKAGNLQAARLHAHTGAGSCAACGIVEGQETLRRMERLIEGGDVERSLELLPVLRRVLAAARAELYGAQ